MGKNKNRNKNKNKPNSNLGVNKTEKKKVSPRVIQDHIERMSRDDKEENLNVVRRSNMPQTQTPRSKPQSKRKLSTARTLEEEEDGEDVTRAKQWLRRNGCGHIADHLVNYFRVVVFILIAIAWFLFNNYVVYPLFYKGSLVKGTPRKPREEGSWNDFFDYPYGKPGP